MMEITTAIEADNMIVKRVSVPLGLEELMEGLTKEVLLQKPKDIYIFASEYFAKLLQLRDKSTKKGWIPVRKARSVVKPVSATTSAAWKSDESKAKSLDVTQLALARQQSVRSESPVAKNLRKKESLIKSEKNEKSKGIFAKYRSKSVAKEPDKVDASPRSISSSRKVTPREVKLKGLTPRGKSHEAVAAQSSSNIKVDGKKLLRTGSENGAVRIGKSIATNIVPKALKQAGILTKDAESVKKLIKNESNKKNEVFMFATNGLLIEEKENSVGKNNLLESTKKSLNADEDVDSNVSTLSTITSESTSKQESGLLSINENDAKDAYSSSNSQVSETGLEKNTNIDVVEDDIKLDADNKNNTISVLNSDTNVLVEESTKLDALTDKSLQSVNENNLNNVTTNNINDAKNIFKNDELVEESTKLDTSKNNLLNKADKALQSVTENNSNNVTTNNIAENSFRDDSAENSKTTIFAEKIKNVKSNLQETDTDSVGLLNEISHSKTDTFTDKNSNKEPNQAVLKELEENANKKLNESNILLDPVKNKTVMKEEGILKDSLKPVLDIVIKDSETLDAPQEQELKGTNTLALNNIAKDEVKKSNIEDKILKDHRDLVNDDSIIIENLSLLEVADHAIELPQELQNIENDTIDNLKISIDPAITLNKEQETFENNKPKSAEISGTETTKTFSNFDASKLRKEITEVTDLVPQKFKTSFNPSILKQEIKEAAKVAEENRMQDVVLQTAAALRIQRLWRRFATKKTSLKSQNIEVGSKTLTSEPTRDKKAKVNEQFKIVNAVLTIQKIWRGFQIRNRKKRGELFGNPVDKKSTIKEELKTRTKEKPQQSAALKIQSLWRGYKVRKGIDTVNDRLTSLSDERDKKSSEVEIFKAASKIQAGYRGYKVRKKRSALTSILEEKNTENPKTDASITKSLNKLIKTPSIDSIKRGQLEKLKTNSLETDQNVGFDGYIINDQNMQTTDVLAREADRNFSKSEVEKNEQLHSEKINTNLNKSEALINTQQAKKEIKTNEQNISINMEQVEGKNAAGEEAKSEEKRNDQLNSENINTNLNKSEALIGTQQVEKEIKTNEKHISKNKEQVEGKNATVEETKSEDKKNDQLHSENISTNLNKSEALIGTQQVEKEIKTNEKHISKNKEQVEGKNATVEETKSEDKKNDQLHSENINTNLNKSEALISTQQVEKEIKTNEKHISKNKEQVEGKNATVEETKSEDKKNDQLHSENINTNLNKSEALIGTQQVEKEIKTNEKHISKNKEQVEGKNATVEETKSEDKKNDQLHSENISTNLNKSEALIGTQQVEKEIKTNEKYISKNKEKVESTNTTVEETKSEDKKNEQLHSEKINTNLNKSEALISTQQVETKIKTNEQNISKNKEQVESKNATVEETKSEDKKNEQLHSENINTNLNKSEALISTQQVETKIKTNEQNISKNKEQVEGKNAADEEAKFEDKRDNQLSSQTIEGNLKKTQALTNTSKVAKKVKESVVNDRNMQTVGVLASEVDRNLVNLTRNSTESIDANKNASHIDAMKSGPVRALIDEIQTKSISEGSISGETLTNKAANEASAVVSYEEAPTRPVTSDVGQKLLAKGVSIAAGEEQVSSEEAGRSWSVQSSSSHDSTATVISNEAENRLGGLVQGQGSGVEVTREPNVYESDKIAGNVERGDKFDSDGLKAENLDLDGNESKCGVGRNSVRNSFDGVEDQSNSLDCKKGLDALNVSEEKSQTDRLKKLKQDETVVAQNIKVVEKLEEDKNGKNTYLETTKNGQLNSQSIEDNIKKSEAFICTEKELKSNDESISKNKEIIKSKVEVEDKNELVEETKSEVKKDKQLNSLNIEDSLRESEGLINTNKVNTIESKTCKENISENEGSNEQDKERKSLVKEIKSEDKINGQLNSQSIKDNLKKSEALISTQNEENKLKTNEESLSKNEKTVKGKEQVKDKNEVIEEIKSEDKINGQFNSQSIENNLKNSETLISTQNEESISKNEQIVKNKEQVENKIAFIEKTKSYDKIDEQLNSKSIEDNLKKTEALIITQKVETKNLKANEKNISENKKIVKSKEQFEDKNALKETKSKDKKDGQSNSQSIEDNFQKPELLISTQEEKKEFKAIEENIANNKDIVKEKVEDKNAVVEATKSADKKDEQLISQSIDGDLNKSVALISTKDLEKEFKTVKESISKNEKIVKSNEQVEDKNPPINDIKSEDKTLNKNEEKLVKSEHFLQKNSAKNNKTKKLEDAKVYEENKNKDKNVKKEKVQLSKDRKLFKVKSAEEKTNLKRVTKSGAKGNKIKKSNSVSKIDTTTLNSINPINKIIKPQIDNNNKESKELNETNQNINLPKDDDKDKKQDEEKTGEDKSCKLLDQELQNAEFVLADKNLNKSDSLLDQFNLNSTNANTIMEINKNNDTVNTVNSVTDLKSESDAASLNTENKNDKLQSNEAPTPNANNNQIENKIGNKVVINNESDYKAKTDSNTNVNDLKIPIKVELETVNKNKINENNENTYRQHLNIENKETAPESTFNVSNNPSTINNDSNKKREGDSLSNKVNKKNNEINNDEPDKNLKSINYDLKIIENNSNININQHDNIEQNNKKSCNIPVEETTDQLQLNKANATENKQENFDANSKLLPLQLENKTTEIEDNKNEVQQETAVKQRQEIIKAENLQPAMNHVKITKEQSTSTSTHDDLGPKITTKSSSPNNKIDLTKLHQEIFETTNYTIEEYQGEAELLYNEKLGEIYIPLRELSDIKEETEPKGELNITPEVADSLKIAGEKGDSLREMHEPVALPTPATSNNEHREREVASSSASEVQENAPPNTDPPPAGPALLTSPMSESISARGGGTAQASIKDASTCGAQRDRPLTSMETEKRNNASLPKKNMETEAATKIQAGFRGYQVRKQMKNKISSPGHISSQRRSARRKSSGRLANDSNRQSTTPKGGAKSSSDLEEKSAVKIQAGIRGFLVRRRQKKQKDDGSA